jgi:transposase
MNTLIKIIVELEARLARYENAHTPPSLKHGGNRKKDQEEGPRESQVRRKAILA